MPAADVIVTVEFASSTAIDSAKLAAALGANTTMEKDGDHEDIYKVTLPAGSDKNTASALGEALTSSGALANGPESKVSVEGEPENGVATYAVTITAPDGSTEKAYTFVVTVPVVVTVTGFTIAVGSKGIEISGVESTVAPEGAVEEPGAGAFELTAGKSNSYTITVIESEKPENTTVTLANATVIGAGNLETNENISGVSATADKVTFTCAPKVITIIGIKVSGLATGDFAATVSAAKNCGLEQH